MASRIEDYAMIGDCHTAALVGADGSLDWLCLPRFDSPACFAALLGGEENGLWRITPTGNVTATRRAYVDGSLVLETEFTTETGCVRLTDFMPVGQGGRHVVRIVRGLSGSCEMRLLLVVRFGYGIIVPWAEQHDQDRLVFVAGPDMLVLRSPIPLDGGDEQTTATFEVREGESFPFVLSYGLSHQDHPTAFGIKTAYNTTLGFWTSWSDQCAEAGRWTQAVKRSLITLKALTYQPTGGIAAAATTSLPEKIGGARNWDYRYCWLRDAAFAVLAFLRAGYSEEAHSFRDWLLRAVAGSPRQIQIMYGLSGERRLDEYEAPWLTGYEASAPVRIGNAAVTQSQLDVFGELFEALALAVQGGLAPVQRSPELRRVILEHLEKIWSQPDSGIWEVRGEPRQFTHSKVMAWVAFDRAAHSEPMSPDAAERSHYRAVADRIHADVCEKGIDPKRNCFVQAYGSDQMDAGLLLLALVGFLPPDDVRIRNTVAEVERRLVQNRLVLRYETASEIDGLAPGEGSFLACSFWLVENYVLQGRSADAERLFGDLVGLGNDVGLLSEEYDVADKRMLGNFPQALSHMALVNAAYALAGAHRASQSPSQ
jgi:GH15 family glucan-1,4-alpha-glucosidase